MTSINKKRSALATLATAAALALTLSACGSGGTSGGQDPKTNDTYDFTQPSAQSSHQVVIEVDQNLIDANDDYAKNRYIERVTVRPLEIDSTQLCAMTLDYELLGDPIEKIYQARSAEDDDELSDKGLRQSIVGSVLGQWPAPELEEPNLDDPVRGVYYSEDDSVVTVIDKCAATPNADYATYEVEFTRAYEDTGFRTLAIAPVGVTSQGEVFAANGTVNDWKRDPSGTWVHQ